MDEKKAATVPSNEDHEWVYGAIPKDAIWLNDAFDQVLARIETTPELRPICRRRLGLTKRCLSGDLLKVGWIPIFS